ncbi:MAG: dihydrodipicolinate synthase family protein [Alphaproteobacteria bacterium]|nr:dihydrodipicolinate synthase family protein [Alphaproteobacteria bacterium]
MAKKKIDFEGPSVAMVTPFKADGSIDEAAHKLNVRQCIDTGLTSVMCSGCTGEFWALTKEERKRVYKLTVEAASGRVPVVAGTGAIRTEDAIELSEAAKAAGCNAVMVINPFFVKPSVDDLIAHYRAISDAVAIPIMLYNIPSATTNPLTPEIVSKLSDIKNVVAIKESSFDFNNFTRTLQLAGDRIHVFGYGLPGLMAGASGSFHVHANYWDERASESFFAFKRGDVERAKRIHDQSLAVEAVFNDKGRNYYVSVKAAMNLFGRPGGYNRKPLRPLPEAELAEMKVALAKAGLVPYRGTARAVAE